MHFNFISSKGALKPLQAVGSPTPFSLFLSYILKAYHEKTWVSLPSLTPGPQLLRASNCQHFLFCPFRNAFLWIYRAHLCLSTFFDIHGCIVFFCTFPHNIASSKSLQGRAIAPPYSFKELYIIHYIATPCCIKLFPDFYATKDPAINILLHTFLGTYLSERSTLKLKLLN